MYVTFMNNTQVNNRSNTPRVFDKLGVLLSVFCGIHCLVTPFLFASLPWLSSYFSNEVFHVFIIVLSSTLVTLSIKSRKNISKNTLIQMLLGLLFLSIGVLTHILHAETDIMVHQKETIFENIFTLLGGLLLFVAHYKRVRSGTCEALYKGRNV